MYYRPNSDIGDLKIIDNIMDMNSEDMLYNIVIVKVKVVR